MADRPRWDDKTWKNKPEPRVTRGVTERRDAKVEPYALLDTTNANSGMTHRGSNELLKRFSGALKEPALYGVYVCLSFFFSHEPKSNVKINQDVDKIIFYGK